MNHSLPEINELLLQVEQKYTKKLSSTTNFEEFSLHLDKNEGIQLSVSTLKRLWGYVNDKHKPREHTLDQLSVYLGFKDFGAFCQHLKTSKRYNSSFFSTMQIHSKDLAEGCWLEIGWSPNRYIKLCYIGDMRFEVLDARNSKLMKGDRFETITFLAGQPLSLPYIERDGNRTPPFIGGRNGGLTLLKIVPNE